MAEKENVITLMYDLLLYVVPKLEKFPRSQKFVLGDRIEHLMLDVLEQMLAAYYGSRTGMYQPGSYHTFQIYEPKPRMISAAPYRDREVHHALCNIIEPILERSLIFDT